VKLTAIVKDHHFCRHTIEHFIRALLADVLFNNAQGYWDSQRSLRLPQSNRNRKSPAPHPLFGYFVIPVCFIKDKFCGLNG
jgi:hypothetical protein